MTALSPRNDPPPLQSTNPTPRRTRSKYDVVATARGWTVKAGATTRARLHKSIPIKRTPRPRPLSQPVKGEGQG